jgi:hypothetical protein
MYELRGLSRIEGASLNPQPGTGELRGSILIDGRAIFMTGAIFMAGGGLLIQPPAGLCHSLASERGVRHESVRGETRQHRVIAR